MSEFSELVKTNKELSLRKDESEKRIAELKIALNEHPFIKGKDICIYLTGSLSRKEYGSKSDVDVFIISRSEIKRVEEYAVYSALIEINEKLGYPEFSNDARYLKIYSLADLISATGSPRDDSENLFTARQLLILESTPLYNEEFFKQILHKILCFYYADDNGERDFKPIFLLNDILRYWRTLCVNYEQIRRDKDRPWRKKNINLKFSRKITVFSTVIPMVLADCASIGFLKSLFILTPLERLALALDKINNRDFLDKFKEFLIQYELFIAAKENVKIEDDKNTKNKLDENAIWITRFISDIVHDPNIDQKMKIYLVQ